MPGFSSRSSVREAQPRSAGRPVGVLRWVTATVVVFHMLMWMLSIAVLLSQVGAVQSEFADGAMRDHGGYVLMNNLALLVGYGIVSTLFVLLLYPIVSFWLRKLEPTRWSVIWRTLVGLVLVSGGFFLRIMALRPYHINQWFETYHMEVIPAMPGRVGDVFVFVTFTLVPLAFAASISWFYILKLVRLLRACQMVARRTVYASLAVLAVGLAGGFAVPRVIHALVKPDEAPRMNILILASDSLRSDHLSFNGYYRKTSPNIDALAEESVTFRQCLTPIGSTLESMTGMMSSQYPHTHGLRNMFPTEEEVGAVNRNAPALARTLAENGYDTAVVGDWCAAIFNEVPLGFGEIEVAPFDSFRIWLSEAVYLSHPVVPMYFDNEFGYWLFPKLQSFAHYLRPEVVTERAIEKLDEQKLKGTPFFMTVFCGANHFAYHAPYPYYQKWSDPDYDGPSKFQVKFDMNAFTTRTDWDEAYMGLDPAERQHVIDLYDGCVSEFDDCVGRIIARLKENGQLENTIVIVTSDHGEDLFDPGATLCHGVSFNGGDQGNRVPLVMHVPGESPKVVEKIVRNIDVAPTLLDLVGMPVPQLFEGRSLVGYLRGPEADLDLAYYGETSYPFYRRHLPDGYESMAIPPFDKMTYVDKEHDYRIVLKDKFNGPVIASKERCLRTENFKLVFTPGEDGPVHRLFDVRADPHCQRDVKREHPEMYLRMKWFLWRWILHHEEAGAEEIESGPVPEDFQVPEEFVNVDW